MYKSTAIKSKQTSIVNRYLKYRQMFYLMIPAVVIILIFKYAPMYGVIIAFKKYQIFKGIFGSPWVGFANFARMFSAANDFGSVFRNTIEISLLRLIFGFPAPIILALLINEVGSSVYKRITQSISYLPHFLSWVILAGLFKIFLSPSAGPINHLIQALGGDQIYFLANAQWFRPVLICTGVWQGMGWGSIMQE